MRIISQDGKIDLPYEMTALTVRRVAVMDDKSMPDYHFCIYGMFYANKYLLAEYQTEEEARQKIEEIYQIYANEPRAAVIVLRSEDESEVADEREP